MTTTEEFNDKPTGGWGGVTALPATPMGVKVKPLEWCSYTANAGWLFYLWYPQSKFNKSQLVVRAVRFQDHEYDVQQDVVIIGYYDDFSGAKLAAQADYEARMLAALTPSPTPTLGDALELLPIAAQSIGNARYKLDTGFSESAEDMVYEHSVISDILGDLESGLFDLRAALAALKGGALCE